MHKLKFVAMLLCTVILLSPAPCFNVFAEMSGSNRIATECMSDDLTEPLDSVETAAAADGVLELSAQSAILIEQKNGKVLFEKNSHEKLAPASVTKVMSLLLIFEAVDDGKLSMDTVVTVSEYAASMGGSQIWLEPNEKMTVDELLRAAVIASANDATVALAETVSGSCENFVAAMNERAKELGANDCNFVNPTGLDAEGHFMSANDIALISAELIKHEKIKDYSTVWMDTLRDGKTELVNTNKLVKFYDGATGLKTGTTSAAGCCLSASAEREGLSVIAVVMKAPTSKERFADARKLLDYAFANFSFKEVKAEKANLKNVRVKSGIGDFVAAIPEKSVSILIKKGTDEKLSQEVDLSKELTAPVKKGDRVGVCKIKYDGEVIGEINITADRNIEKLNFPSALKLILRAFACS